MPSASGEKVFDLKINYHESLKELESFRLQLLNLTQAQKEMSKEFKDGKISQQEYAKYMTETKAASDKYKQSVSDIEKSLRNQIKAEQASEGSLKQLRAQLSEATKQYDSLSRAERNNEEVGGKLRAEVNRLTTEIKNAEEATQRYQRNVGNYENAIKNALGMNTKWGNALIALGKDAQTSGGMLNALSNQVKAFTSSLTPLLSNPIFLSIAGIAGAGIAFKWWVDYNTGLQEATKLTMEFTGKEGDEMREFRNEVSAVADTFDKDFKEVLNSADQLASQFGISVDEAMDMIKDGFVAGADAQGNFLQNLQQYPAAFREAGLSAEEFTAIVSQTKSGIFDEAGLDAIKQANNRIRQMSSTTAASLEAIGIDSQQVTKDLTNGTKTTFDVLQEVSAKLATLPPSSQEVGNALVNVFGRQGRDAGLAMIETLSQMSTDLDEVKQKTGELGTLQEREMQANIDLQNAMSSVFDMTGGTFESLKTNVSVFIKEGVVQLLDYVKQAIQYVKDLYNDSVAFRVAVEAIGGVFRQVWNTIKTIFGLIGNYISSTTKLIKGIFTLDWNTIKSAFTDGLNGIFNSIRNWVNNSIKEVGRLFGVIRQGQQEVDKTAKQANQSSTTTTSTSTATTSSFDEAEIVTSGGGGGGGSTTSSIQDTYSKELQLVRQAEDEMLKMVRDSRLQQQLTIEKSYDRQIEDLQHQLATEKNLTEKGREAINTSIRMLEAQKNADLAQLSEDELQNEIAYRTKLLQIRLESVKKGSDEEYQLRLQQLELQREKDLSDTEMTEEMRLAIIDKYDEQRRELLVQQQADEQQQSLDAITARYEAEFELLGENEFRKTELLVQLAEERRAALSQIEGESDEEFAERTLKADAEVTKAKQKQANEQVKIEKAKNATISGLTDGLIDVTDQLGQTNEAFAKLSKILALGEIAVNTGKAIAVATEKAFEKGFPEAWIDIAQAIPLIMSNIASAISTVNSANFAEGGLVSGAGTGTSDSIPARLSNGESVMTAKATSMFAPLLSSINQIGGGVPISVASSSTTSDMFSDDYLSESFAQSLENLQPVVSVEEISRVSDRVKVVQTKGSW